MAVAAVVGAITYVSSAFAVDLLLRRGRFSAEDAGAVTSLLHLLSLGYVFSMGALLIERYYLAAAKNKILALSSVVRGGIRVLTALALLPWLKLLAFGVGFSVAEASYLIMLAVLLPGIVPPRRPIESPGS